MYGVILAGGAGSRLWPLSRELYPKQLVKFSNGKSGLQLTFERLLELIEPSKIVTVTNSNQAVDTKLQLDQIALGSMVLAEPQAKNTAPAIASTVSFISSLAESIDSGNEIVIILPADHLIKDLAGFKQTIERAVSLAACGYLVTLGVKPTYPETGYGYIKVADKLKGGFKVAQFVEKPELSLAEKYLKAKNYYWNCGIFVAQLTTLKTEFEKLAPELYQIVSGLEWKLANDKAKISEKAYEAMPTISMDYSIMEKSDRIVLVELTADWSDLGSWNSWYEVKPKDKFGNVVEGEVMIEGVKNSYLHSDSHDRLVAAVGVEDLVVIATDDAVMICPRKQTQEVKKLYEQLRIRNDVRHLIHKTVFRPWGSYTCLAAGKGYLTKIITVLPGHKLSLQSHQHRSEHWVVIEGQALVILDNAKHELTAGHSIDIPVGAKHSLQNPYHSELKVLEVQKGEIIAEDDIVRYDDLYGRHLLV